MANAFDLIDVGASKDLDSNSNTEDIAPTSTPLNTNVKHVLILHPTLKMPPKKKDGDAPKRVILGRSTNNLKMGIVGLPNVGKSSLFNTLSKLSVAAENFPFCTIDPNVAKVNGE